MDRLLMTDVADVAQAEHESGAVEPDSYDQGWLRGVEEALRWAAHGDMTQELRELLDRTRRAGTTFARATGSLSTPDAP